MPVSEAERAAKFRERPDSTEILTFITRYLDLAFESFGSWRAELGQRIGVTILPSTTRGRALVRVNAGGQQIAAVYEDLDGSVKLWLLIAHTGALASLERFGEVRPGQRTGIPQDAVSVEWSRREEVFEDPLIVTAVQELATSAAAGKLSRPNWHFQAAEPYVR